jgi:hypothetical protein
MGMHDAPRECHQPLSPSQIADLRLAASKMTGSQRRAFEAEMTVKYHIPTDLVVAQEASDVESSSRLVFLLLHNLRRRFVT